MKWRSTKTKTAAGRESLLKKSAHADTNIITCRVNLHVSPGNEKLE